MTGIGVVPCILSSSRTAPRLLVKQTHPSQTLPLVFSFRSSIASAVCRWNYPDQLELWQVPARARSSGGLDWEAFLPELGGTSFWVRSWQQNRWLKGLRPCDQKQELWRPGLHILALLTCLRRSLDPTKTHPDSFLVNTDNRSLLSRRPHLGIHGTNMC